MSTSNGKGRWGVQCIFTPVGGSAGLLSWKLRRMDCKGQLVCDGGLCSPSHRPFAKHLCPHEIYLALRRQTKMHILNITPHNGKALKKNSVGEAYGIVKIVPRRRLRDS